MKTMKKTAASKKPLMKAKNGKAIKKYSSVDPEGNTVKVRENTNTGKTVTKVKYADPVSSGAKKERIVEKTPRKVRNINKMYANNPKAAAEDDFTPIEPTVKTKIKKAMYGTSMKPTMMKKGGTTKKSK
jgi:hypothetical protein